MAKQMKIGQHMIGAGHPCFIIAEAGVNHNGSLEMAKQLVDAAKKAGVDAVKFQTFKTEDLILSNIEKAAYQKTTTDAAESQTAMLKKLEIDKDFHLALIDYCAKQQITFMSTCYEKDSLDLLVELGVPAIKIASTDTTNFIFLEQAAQTKKPIILSTGMCSEDEITVAYETLIKNGCDQLALLKCTSNYPTQDAEVNLRAMLTLQQKFDAVIGFSDHTPGVGATPYAVALSAKIVEKHFTLDKKLPGPDHQASLSPEELGLWVKEIRKVEAMLGGSELSATASEKETKKSLQKCLVSKVGLKKGDVLTRANIIAKRTGGRGVPASACFEVLGKRVTRDIPQDQLIEWSQLNEQ